MIGITNRRSRLLTGGALAVIAATGATAALAAPSGPLVTVTSDSSIGIIQDQNTWSAASTQTLDGNTNAGIIVVTGDVNASTVTVGTSPSTGNVTSAAGYGNDASLAIVTTLNNDPVSGFQGSAQSDYNGDATTTADVAIALSQTNTNVDASADNYTDMTISTGLVGASSLTVAGNTAQATGSLNGADNSLTASVNNTGTTSAIANTQRSIDSDLTATTDALNGIDTAAVDASTLSVSGNTQRAIAAGNTGANTQSLTANNVNLLSPSGGNSLGYFGGGATASYATSSSQRLSGDGNAVTATVDGDGAGFAIGIDGSATDATVSNTSNRALATARGNDVTSLTSIIANSITTTGSILPPVTQTVAAIGSSQAVEGYAVTANAMGAAGAAVSTSVIGDADHSTLDTSSNTISADATGNRGSSAIDVAATSIDNSLGNPAQAIADFGYSSADASFAVSNAQLVNYGSSVGASLVSAGDPPVGASVGTSVDGSVLDSTVRSNGNSLSANATGNLIGSGGNAITLTATSVTSSTAVSSLQEMDGTMSATIGAAGSAGTPATPPGDPTPFNYNATLSSTATYDNGTQTVASGTFTVDKATLTSDEITYLVDNGWTDAGTTLTKNAAGTSATLGDFGNWLESGKPFSDALPGTPGSPGTPATPGSGGVTVAVGDDILRSSVSVDGNSATGSVTGNDATNRISVVATSIAPSSTGTTGTADPSTIDGATATAEHALANRQSVGETTLSTSVTSDFGITTAGDGIGLAASDVDSSKLSVSNNTVSGSTTGNRASNSIALSATDLQATSALVSVQSSDAAVATTTTMNAYAPAANLDSTLDINGNRNQSLATINMATNSVSIGAANMASSNAGTDASLTADVAVSGDVYSYPVATGDAALNNVQSANASVAATASTLVNNYDNPLVTDGVSGSTVRFNGNVTSAEANANVSSNSMTLAGGSSSDATGGVLNAQSSTAGVTATAGSTVALGVTGVDDTGPLSASTVSISNNVTTSRAGGNSANNALNASALSTTATGSGTPDVQIASGAALNSVSASFAVLNQQGNSGAIAASTNVTYGAGFDAGVGGTTASDASTVALNGNVAQSVAFGNSATNSLTLTALNSNGSSSAIGSTQYNSGNIAALTNANVGVGTLGGVNASQVSVGGSTVSATAVGNSVTSTLIRN